MISKATSAFSKSPAKEKLTTAFCRHRPSPEAQDNGHQTGSCVISLSVIDRNEIPTAVFEGCSVLRISSSTRQHQWTPEVQSFDGFEIAFPQSLILAKADAW
jgi:hypothetical protein